MAGPARVRSGASLPFYFYSKTTLLRQARAVHLLTRSYLQAFLFDFLILVFTIWGLYRQHAAHDSALWRTLYRQGILYFVATLLVNVPLLVGRPFPCFRRDATDALFRFLGG